MGLFGPSTSELEEQISDMRDGLVRHRNERNALEDDVRTLTQKVGELESQVEDLERGLSQAQRICDPKLTEETIDINEGEMKVLDETKVAWKRVCVKDPKKNLHKLSGKDYVVKLYLPKGTKVVSPKGAGPGKARVNQAIVGGVYDREDFKSSWTDDEEARAARWVGVSSWDQDFEYVIGEFITPDNGFDETLDEACLPGIHIYPERKWL